MTATPITMHSPSMVTNSRLLIPQTETKDTYSIRLQTTDSGGLTFEKSLTLTADDVEEDESKQINASFDGEYLYYYFNPDGDVSLISPGLQDEDESPFEHVYYQFKDASDGIYSTEVGTGTTRFRDGASATLPREIWVKSRI